jgi:uncharacterized protein
MRHTCTVVMLIAVFGAATRLSGGGREAAIIDTVKSGDAAALRALLRNKPDVNAAEVDGTTALHWAAHRGDFVAVDMLLRAGAKVAATNRYGVTPLSLAAQSAPGAVIERLLKSGANPNEMLPGGETALMTAARAGKADVVGLLLAHRADPNAVESTRGQTALMWAAVEGHAAVIRKLIESGADVQARSHAPVTAPSYENYSPVSGYRNYARRPRVDALTPILFAARAGHIDAIKALVAGGANVNDKAEDETSALMFAIINAHFEAGASLLDLGADPNNADLGWTALHQVARVRTLNTGEFPPPVPTGRISSLELAKRLIAKGADVNARMTVNDFGDGFTGGWTQRKGASPLLLAAKGVDYDYMRLLLSSGADPHATNVGGTNALMLAAGVELGQLGVHSGTSEDALEAVKIALDLGLDVNAADDKGETALHGGAYRGSPDIVQLLVDRGARLDAINKNGCTPIRIANGERNAGCGRGATPEAFTLLQRLMTERGMPIELRSAEEKYKFGSTPQ